jgi:hypothetical protein
VQTHANVSIIFVVYLTMSAAQAFNVPYYDELKVVWKEAAVTPKYIVAYFSDYKRGLD